MEKVVETKTCRLCSVSFDITDKDREFYEKVSPVFKTPLTLPLYSRVTSLPYSAGFTSSGEEQTLPPDKSLSSTGLGRDGGGYTYLIPTPTLCPDCRQQRRTSFRNERNLYKRMCDATGKEIISIYSPDKLTPVFQRDFWLGDGWNPLDYEREISFSCSFFEQFLELSCTVPRPAVHQEGNNENSEFTNEVDGHKNCYLTFDGSFNESLLYSNWVGNSKNSVDCSYSFGIENCYQCFNCYESYQLYFSLNCHKCSYSWYLTECSGCDFCIGCVGLNNVSYHIDNRPVTKEEYKKEVDNIQKQKNKGMEITKKSLKFPRKANIIRNSENVLGNNITNSSYIFYGFDVLKCQDCKYVYDIWDSKSVMDFYEGWMNPELCYEGETSGGSYHCAFTQRCIQCKYTYYSSFLFNCEYCFLCVGLTRKSYCILNKQYTKEAYEELVPRIIEHMMKTPLIKGESDGKEQGDFVAEWGEFFPSSVSLFGYNESMAQEYFPLSRTDVIPVETGFITSHSLQTIVGTNNDSSHNQNSGGFLHGPIFNWSDYEAPFPKVEKSIPASKLPDDIAKIPDDILNWAIECEITKKPFRIIKQELEFYRKHHLPIPRKHPDQRHKERMQLRNPRKLYTRHCDKCQKEIQTTYAPERPEIVYCEECYNKEVY